MRQILNRETSIRTYGVDKLIADHSKTNKTAQCLKTIPMFINPEVSSEAGLQVRDFPSNFLGRKQCNDRKPKWETYYNWE